MDRSKVPPPQNEIQFLLSLLHIAKPGESAAAQQAEIEAMIRTAAGSR